MEKSKRGIIVAVMLAMILAAVESTVVTIAVPTIVGDLNGFELVSWVFSLYLLTSSVTTPVYGKLADLYGRKNILSVGIMIFLAGSAGCGISQSMHQLILFRGVQGMGAGAIYTITYTIVGDQFPISQRARVQGWLSSTWGIASLAGPFIGGALIDVLSWHWIFFINVPFGIISIILLQKNIVENLESKQVKLDYKGVVVLSIAIVSLLFGFMSKNNDYGMNYIRLGIFCTISVVSMLLFYKVEKKADDPIIPFEIFDRASFFTNAISFMLSAILMGIDVYMAIYIQNVLGYNATISGLVMAPMSLTWLLSTIFIGDKIVRFGEKRIIIISGFITLTGSFLLLSLGTDSSIFFVILFSALLGIGFGTSFTTLTIFIQLSVDYNMRGVATASNTLLRNLGQTIGVSVFGSVFNIFIMRYLKHLNISNINPNDLYSKYQEVSISEDMVKSSLNYGLHVIFIGMILISLGIMISAFMLPDNKKAQ